MEKTKRFRLLLAPQDQMAVVQLANSSGGNHPGRCEPVIDSFGSTQTEDVASRALRPMSGGAHERPQ